MSRRIPRRTIFGTRVKGAVTPLFPIITGRDSEGRKYSRFYMVFFVDEETVKLYLGYSGLQLGRDLAGNPVAPYSIAPKEFDRLSIFDRKVRTVVYALDILHGEDIKTSVERVANQILKRVNDDDPSNLWNVPAGTKRGVVSLFEN